MHSPHVSVVVINYRRPDLTDACLRSVAPALEHVPGGAELLVLDNDSGDGSVELLRERHRDMRIEALPQNLGFAGAAQRAIELTSGEWIAFVNNDAEIEPDALARMLEEGARDPRVGAVAPQIRFNGSRDRVNSAGLEVDQLGIGFERLAGHAAAAASVSCGGEVFGATGCVALYRRAMLDEIGGFDASFFAYLEDADVAWRARMVGWQAVYVPDAIAYHHASATARERSHQKYFLTGRNRVRLIAKNATRRQLARWGLGMIAYDLAYVAWVALTDRSLAPLRGRLRGLREWRAYRRAGAPGRRPVALAGTAGPRGALRMRAAYRNGASPSSPPRELVSLGSVSTQRARNALT
jgi:GT2 family glycosyltransferase